MMKLGDTFSNGSITWVVVGHGQERVWPTDANRKAVVPCGDRDDPTHVIGAIYIDMKHRPVYAYAGGGAGCSPQTIITIAKAEATKVYHDPAWASHPLVKLHSETWGSAISASYERAAKDVAAKF